MANDEFHQLSGELVIHASRLVRAVRQLSTSQTGARLLSLLDQHGPLGITGLANLDRCSQPSMSSQVAALQKRGWVTKSPHPEDARSQLVELTRDGRDELARVRRVNADLVASRLQDTTDHTTEDLATAVAVLRDLLETPEGSAWNPR